MLAIALAVASSVAWGTSDFIGGLKARALPVLVVLLASQAVGLALMAAIVAVRAEGPPDGDFAVYAAASAVAGLVGLAALFRGLAIGTMGVVAPLSSTAVAVPVIVGVATGERPSAAQAAGLAVALAGMVMAAREPREEGGSGLAAGAGLALVAALGFGCFFLGMDKASDADVPWAILVNRISGVALLVAAFAALRPRGRPGRVDVPPLVAIGALDMTANTLFAVATTKGLVSLVSVVAALYPVTTVVLARAVLGERLAVLQRTGIVLAFAGVALIAAG